MALEKYMAIAGLALCIFFVSEILTLFKKVAIQASVGTFFQTMYNIVDTYIAGKISQ